MCHSFISNQEQYELIFSFFFYFRYFFLPFSFYLFSNRYFIPVHCLPTMETTCQAEWSPCPSTSAYCRVKMS